MKSNLPPIKVLIVDDSAFARYIIAKYITADDTIEVVGTAHDGYDAIKKVKEFKPDVITLDIEMPHMDGLSALEKIMSDYPTPTIMLSSLTSEGADATIKALELGAADFYLKPSLTNTIETEAIFKDLVKKIKSIVGININHLVHRRIAPQTKDNRKNYKKHEQLKTDDEIQKVIIIGSSTGGPRALYEIIPTIPADIPATILMVQHMPPKFTKSMAERLNQLSEISIKEAENGDLIKTGQALLAPGGYHMCVGNNKKILLTDDKPRSGLRPCVDTTMETAVNIFGNICTGVILTGMGHDGTQGAAAIKAMGGTVIAQDEGSCVVYGMPRSVVENGLADKVVPLNEIVKEILVNCKERVVSIL